MAAQQAGAGAARAAVDARAGRLGADKARGATTEASWKASATTLAEVKTANDARAAFAANLASRNATVQSEAAGRRDDAISQRTDKQASLETWAAAHRQERAQAVEQTCRRLEDRGFRVVEVTGAQ